MRPSSSSALGSAPASVRASTISSWRPVAARCRGALPSQSRAFASAPASARTPTAWTRPLPLVGLCRSAATRRTPERALRREGRPGRADDGFSRGNVSWRLECAPVVDGIQGHIASRSGADSGSGQRDSGGDGARRGHPSPITRPKGVAGAAIGAPESGQNRSPWKPWCNRVPTRPRRAGRPRPTCRWPPRPGTAARG